MFSPQLHPHHHQHAQPASSWSRQHQQHHPLRRAPRLASACRCRAGDAADAAPVPLAAAADDDEQATQHQQPQPQLDALRQQQAELHDRAAAAAVGVHQQQPGAGALSEQAVRQARSQLMRRMLVFMGPALIIPLADPLMTLTDTIFIGQFAGTQELAAMGPANICFSFSQYIFQSLQIAAIGLISDDLRRGLMERAEHTFQVALSMAVGCGVVLLLLMEVCAEQLIAGTGADATLVPLAASYMRIRALAQPAVLVTMACQGGLLAQRDSRTPALAVGLGVTVNIVCNCIAVGHLGLGLQGAAATTVATQVAGATMLLLVARRTSDLAPGLCRVDLQSLRRFAVTMGPLSVTYVCKNLCYILLQTAAATLSFVQLAAHQAVFSVWNLLAFTTAPLEQAALAFIPAAGSRAERRTTLQLLGGVSAAIGATCGLLAAGVPLLAPQLLTRDAAVWGHMAAIAPLAMVAMVLAAADVGAAGVLLAQRDYNYVARAFVVTLLLLAAFVSLFVRGPNGFGLTGVWVALVLFFGLRCVQSVGRLLWLHHTQQHYQGHQQRSEPEPDAAGWPDASAAAPQLGS